MQVGKYQLIRQLAVGGMAEVFLARTSGPMGFEKQLVLKRVLPHLAQDPSFIQMFLGEATLVARLTHPNIVQIFDFGESNGTYYLAMEYIDGPSLRTLLDDSLRLGGPLPATVCARIISAACEGLAFAHDFKDPTTGNPLDIVHRDISPDNLLLSRQGGVKVADFGIAKASGQQHKTQTGMIKGKVAYMPPEQIRNESLDRRVDVYALGVVLYELLTGQRPYHGDTDVGLMHSILFDSLVPAAQLQPGLPEPVLRILDRAMARDRDQRYPDCAALQAALEEYLVSTGKAVTTAHVAQLIAQVSPPRPETAPLPLPLSTAPLADTEVRPAVSQVGETQQSLMMADTLMRPAIPSDAALKAASSSAPARMDGKRRAALAGAVLIAVAGGYLFSQRHDPPQPVPALPVAAPPTIPAPAPPVEPSLPQPVTPTTAQPETNPVAPPPPSTETPTQEPPSTASTQIDPSAESGLIEIEVRPRANIYLEGKMLAKAETRASFDVNPGTYTLRFVSSKPRRSAERLVEVKAGQTAFVVVDLLEEEAQKP